MAAIPRVFEIAVINTIASGRDEESQVLLNSNILNVLIKLLDASDTDV